ncbi:MAG: acyl carrier protein [Pseudonocardiaceae bacterium]
MNADSIAEIFRRVLAIEAVEEDSNFFALGGDSLLATRVLSAIARQCGTELSFDDFADTPSPDALSRKIMSVLQ